MRRFICRLLMALLGWKVETPPPGPRKAVVVGAPHSTNWDGVFTVLIAGALDLKLHWMGKHTLFSGWKGPLLRALGGLSVDRRASHGVVGEMARIFGEQDDLYVVIAPEGTRKRAAYWKSGFYHIAREAGVPIVLAYVDYDRKRGGFGAVVHPSGDIRADMDLVRAFYANHHGKYPENNGPIRVREEEVLAPPRGSVPADTSESEIVPVAAALDARAPGTPRAG